MRKAVGLARVASIHSSDLASEVLRPSRFDALVLLGLLCLRRASMALLWLGLGFAGLYGTVSESDLLVLNDPAKVISALKTPLVGVALSIVLRFLTSTMAVAAAMPLARQEFKARRGAPDKRADWVDLIYLASAYRSLRWTRAVIELAVAQSGIAGRLLRLLSQMLLVVSVISFLALPVVGWVLVR